VYIYYYGQKVEFAASRNSVNVFVRNAQSNWNWETYADYLATQALAQLQFLASLDSTPGTFTIVTPDPVVEACLADQIAQQYFLDRGYPRDLVLRSAYHLCTD